MKTNKLILTIGLLLSTISQAQAKDVLKCERMPGKYNNFTRTQLVISSTDTGAYTYYASQCKGFHGSYCLTEIGDYESFGEIEAVSGNFINADVSIIRICAGIRVFYDKSENISFDFESRECEVIP